MAVVMRVVVRVEEMEESEVVVRVKVEEVMEEV